jgi:hypothetical protein
MKSFGYVWQAAAAKKGSFGYPRRALPIREYPEVDPLEALPTNYPRPNVHVLRERFESG